jgi:2-oxo-4-hydroxy-4-carboxy--5-ureidoimidazoline (OHCU) decarboxylase
MHVEPVGWQRQGIDELTPEDRALLHDMERSARACRYNLNLLEVLERLARARRLEIKQRKYDFLAHRPDLPGSIIVWRPLTAMTAARPAAA